MTGEVPGIIEVRNLEERTEEISKTIPEGISRQIFCELPRYFLGAILGDIFGGIPRET